jgi:MFS family permease
MLADRPRKPRAGVTSSVGRAPTMSASVPDPLDDRSYRALLAVPALPRVLLGMQIARIAQQMVVVALVLFTLNAFESPALAGVVIFASGFPGIVAAPIAGALLDRHGRTWLVIADYLVAGSAMVLIGNLSLAGVLTPSLLILIAAVASLTAPLSTAGLRSLLPIMVPEHLWERANALDSNGYIIATLLGPALAGLMVQAWGGAVALIAIGVLFAVAAVVLLRIPDPMTHTATTGRILLDAWQGLVYTLRNPTLRALGLTLSTLNLGGGVTTIVLPLIVLDRLHQGEVTVGLLFAVSGVFGMASAFAFGRRDTAGREKPMLVLPMAGYAASLLLFLPLQIATIALAMAIGGFLSGPMDIALFTIRQRRTDPAWMGRAFAVSMYFNFLGFPIGSALAGWIASQSLELAVLFGVAAAATAALIAQLLIPAKDG